jgi:3-oxoacyl-[acyl-carrier-protein] synthase III
VPIHVSISNCANIVAALRVAGALIEAREAEHVLVVSVDKAPSRYGGRKMFQEMSVKSDVSLSCLVSGPGAGQYGILYLGQHNTAALADVCMEASSAYAMEKFKGIRRAAREARDTLELSTADFTRIITNNYGREVMKMFIELCGFPKDTGWFVNLGRFAHAVAGDVLINLKDLESRGAIQPGERLFLLADSVTSSSVLCLQKH